MVYSGLPGPTSSAGFIIKMTYITKRKEKIETQKACKIMKVWDIKGIKRKGRKKIPSLIISYTVAYLLFT